MHDIQDRSIPQIKEMIKPAIEPLTLRLCYRKIRQLWLSSSTSVHPLRSIRGYALQLKDNVVNNVNA